MQLRQEFIDDLEIDVTNPATSLAIGKIESYLDTIQCEVDDAVYLLDISSLSDLGDLERASNGLEQLSKDID
jgi:hypothetical protein